MRRNIAVILAGGIGSRAGAGLPKQLRALPDGRTVLQTCLDTFRACPMIDEICVVMHPDYMSYVPEGVHCIAGGKERWESSWNAIQWLAMHDAQCTMYNVNILLHDCARPFVSQRILDDVCQALETHDAVTVAVPATDTMYVVGGSQCTMHDVRLVDIPDRKTMFRAQTPQAFHLDVIREAYEKMQADRPMENSKWCMVNRPMVNPTDDCGILHRYMPEVPIYIVEGEESNRKLTFKEDFE